MNLKPVAGTKQTGIRQETLWDWVGNRTFDKQAALRTHTGEFYEEASAALLDGLRMTTDSRCLCPDIQHQSDDHLFAEVKSIGRNGQGLLYEQRMEKYEAFAKQGNKVHYLFWFHNAECTVENCPTLYDLHRVLAAHTLRALMIPMELVHARARQQNRVKLNYRGYKDNPRREIMWGYRLPGGWFRECEHGQAPAMAWDIKAYNSTIFGLSWIDLAGWPAP